MNNNGRNIPDRLYSTILFFFIAIVIILALLDNYYNYHYEIEYGPFIYTTTEYSIEENGDVTFIDENDDTHTLPGLEVSILKVKKND